MRNYVIGDIHGAYKALMDCLAAADFDYRNDRLICLGDACDGWPEVNLVLEELLKIEHLVYILGNHDYWALKWFETAVAPGIWLSQGGNATLASYRESIPPSHVELLKKAREYYILNNKLFVHGGIIRDIPLEKQDKEIFLWDRSLVNSAIELHYDALDRQLTSFDEIFLGHTPTLNFDSLQPIKACEVWLMDTGAGWPGGVLSMMNIASHEVFQSRPVDGYYPGYQGRK